MLSKLATDVADEKFEGEHFGLFYPLSLIDANALISLYIHARVRGGFGEATALDPPGIGVPAAGLAAAGRGRTQCFGKKNIYQLFFKEKHEVFFFRSVSPDTVRVVACSSSPPLGPIRPRSRRFVKTIGRAHALTQPLHRSAQNADSLPSLNAALASEELSCLL